MAQGIKTLMSAGGAGPQMLLASRGKGVKRTIYVHVYNATNVTAFFSHDKNLLQQPLTQNDTNLGTQAGIPVGKNGGASPFVFQDWEGDMWGVGSVDGVQTMFEETFG